MVLLLRPLKGQLKVQKRKCRAWTVFSILKYGNWNSGLTISITNTNGWKKDAVVHLEVCPCWLTFEIVFRSCILFSALSVPTVEVCLLSLPRDVLVVSFLNISLYHLHINKLGLVWEEWHQSVAQCIHVDVGWIKVRSRSSLKVTVNLVQAERAVLPLRVCWFVCQQDY